MSFLLDTCVISELARPRPHPAVIAWMDSTAEDALYLSVLTIGELEKGIARLDDSLRRSKLTVWVRGDLVQRFGGRLLSVDVAVSARWGSLVGASESKGVSLPVIDNRLAATSLEHDLVLVTRNTPDFERCGARCLDPWNA